MSDFNVSGADPPDVFTIVDLSPDRALIASKEDAVGPSGLVGWLQPVARVHCARLSRGLMLVRAAPPLPHQHE